MEQFIFDNFTTIFGCIAIFIGIVFTIVAKLKLIDPEKMRRNSFNCDKEQIHKVFGIAGIVVMMVGVIIVLASLK